MTSNCNPHAAADVALAESLTATIAKAADAILAIDFRRAGTRFKDDASPVTAADVASETVILAELARIAPDVPVVSEEQAGALPSTTTFFLVDPLDGTREFIAGRDEYTVNIALIRDGAPALGLIAVPALGLVWRGVVGARAERLSFPPGGGEPHAIEPIHTRAWPARPLATVSRSHFEAASAAFLARLGPIEELVCGSALKFGRIAEGAADVYPRLATTCEWDVAAGHALVTAAGGVMTAPDGAALRYGVTPGFRVPGFIAWGDPAKARQA